MIGVTFWSFSADDSEIRNATGQNEEWKLNQINEQLQVKFDLNFKLPGVFIDALSQRKSQQDDLDQQNAFQRETGKLWDFAISNGDFHFKTIDDIEHEIKELKSELLERKKIQKSVKNGNS